MSISALLLPEYEQEMATTRRVLEGVPSDKGAFKPHEKAFALGHLAQLVAMLPGWVEMTLTRTELDLNPPGGGSGFGYTFESTETLLATFDKNAASGRAALAAVTDD